MNDPHIKIDPREVLLRNTREAVACQVDSIHRNNYLNSCEAHGGDSAVVAGIVRNEVRHLDSLEFYENNH